MFSVPKEQVISGYLPLTHKSDRLLRLLTLGPAIAMVAGAILAAAGAVTMISLPAPSIGGVLLLAGLMLLAGGGIAMLVARPFIGPQGRVIESGSVVELSHVSPAFVTAFKAMQHAN